MTKPGQHLGIDPAKPYIAGDTLEVDVTLDDPQDVLGDLSGVAQITWELKNGIEGAPRGAALISKTLGDGITITDALNRVVRVHLDAGETSGLYGRYVHEIEVRFTGGAVHTTTTGNFQIQRETVEAVA